MKEKLSTYLIVGIIAVLGTAFLGLVIAKTGGSLALFSVLAIFALLISFFYILRNPFYGFLLIVFFLPFERVPVINFAGVDVKINTILGFLTLFCWILALIFDRKNNKLQPNALGIPILIFVFAMFASLFQDIPINLDRGYSVLIFILFTIALSVLAVNMISGINNLKKVVLVLLSSSAVVGLFGLFQFAGDVVGLPASVTLLKYGYDSRVFGFPRIQAFSMEPLYLANYLLIPLSLCLAYFLEHTNIIPFRGKNWWLLGLMAVLLIDFILTVSRGGYLGLIATFVILGIIYFKKIFNLRNLSILIVLVFVFGGVFFALQNSQPRAMNEFIKHVTLNDLNKGESTVGRLSTYNQALIIWSKHKLLGTGLGNFGPFILGFPAQALKTGWPIVNNEFLEILAETGLVGISAFCFIFVVLFYRTWLALKVNKDPFLRATIIGLSAALIGILVQYNFFSTLYIIHIWVLIGLMVGVQNLMLKSQSPNRNIQPNSKPQ